MRISIIAAVSENRVIGKDNKLVWNLPIDMKFFMNTTKGHCILSGRKNYESIPEKFRPLKNRANIVVTTQPNYRQSPPELYVTHSIEGGIKLAEELGEKELFIIGGGQIYQQTIALAHRLYLTEVKHQFEGDTYFPAFERSEWEELSRIKVEANQHNPIAMEFTTLERVRVRSKLPPAPGFPPKQTV